MIQPVEIIEEIEDSFEPYQELFNHSHSMIENGLLVESYNEGNFDSFITSY